MNNLPRTVSRRTVIQKLGLSMTACALPVPVFAGRIPPDGASLPRTSPPGEVFIEARKGQIELLGKGLGHTNIWGYGGSVPGPVIRVKQSDEVRVRFKNSLEQGSTIHWHGIRIDNKMDGVAGLTQELVAPGESFDYRFRVPDAGTYWYHPHNRTWEQMARGLYGLLIVDEKEPPKVDHDIALAFDDWQLKQNGQLEIESFNHIGERAHGGRIGNVMGVNGAPDMNVNVKSGDRVRVRLCSTTNSRILNLRIQGGTSHLIALDGQPVKPRSLKGGLITLAPSQRADLILDMDGAPGSQAVISEISDVRLPLVRFICHSSVESRPEIMRGIERVGDNPLLRPDRSDPLKVKLAMTGGAMGRMESAVYKGKKMTIRELVNGPGMIWAFNGVAGMPKKPLFTAKKGQTVELDMINNTAFPHAMHLHGHHMSELRRVQKTRRGTEIKTSRPDWRDTILLDRAEAVKVGFVADNPGKWMIHCHMLEHQAGGMMTWFEVA